MAWQNNRNLYGKTLGVLFQLEVEYTDGTKETINSNESWNCSTGPVTKSGIYYGEAYDARLEQGQWTQAEFNDKSWKTVSTLSGGKGHLVASYGTPVRKHEIFKLEKISKNENGETIIDFGQTLVGWINQGFPW